MAQYYKYHGINIKTCYADFDKHHIGLVTESQVHIEKAQKAERNPFINARTTLGRGSKLFLGGVVYFIGLRYNGILVPVRASFGLRWRSGKTCNGSTQG